MRAGDIVFHRESGEEWLIAKTCESGFYLAGWPCTRLHESQCDLVRAATDEEHRAVVEQCATLSKDDPRYTPYES